MSEALLDAMPPGGWTTNDLDRMPVSNTRYELTDGALTATPSPSNLHQMLLIKLGARMDAEVPEPYTVTGDVEIRSPGNSPASPT